MARFFRIPFATSGTKTTVPDSAQVDGTVSYDDGYGAKYQLPITDPDALRIERGKMNDIFNDVTDAIRVLQSQGIADWISNADNGGTDYSYLINAVVRYTDGKLYRSLTASNTALPTNASFWVCISDPTSPTQGGTGFSTYTLGEMIYASAANVLAKLSGNTTTTRKFMRQVGDGTNSAAPVWDTLTKTDVGLANVDNTSDVNKPVSTAQATALGLKGSLASSNVWTGQQTVQGTDLTDASSISWNLNTQANTDLLMTSGVGATRVLANPTNMVDKGVYTIRIHQDAAGSRALTYGSAYKWSGGSAPVLSTTANAIDILTFISDGVNMYGTIQKGFA